MSEKRRRKPYKRIALALSLCAIVASVLLGTGASLAWFADTSEEVENVFHMAEFDLDVSYKDGSSYQPVTGETKLFKEQALYEPGYTQVVYLKIENKGTRAFDFKIAVTVTDGTVGTNVYGQPLRLQEHLRFGLVTADTEAELMAQVDTRSEAVARATMSLGNYESNRTELAAKSETYAALVVCMPEEAGNEANYQGNAVPFVDLGIAVHATQIENR